MRRLTFINFKQNSSESARIDEFRRRSTGFWYYLLVPFAPVLIYYGAAWVGWGALRGTVSSLLARVSRRENRGTFRQLR